MPRLGLRAAPPLDGSFSLNRDSPQAQGLAAWWPTLASPSGGAIRDFLGRFNFTIQAGSPTVVPSPLVGLAGDTAGATGRWAVTNTALDPLMGTSAFTVTCWVQPLGTTGNVCPWGKFDGSAFKGPYLRVDPGGSFVSLTYFDNTGSSRGASSGVNIAQYECALIACGYNGIDELFCQVNGQRTTASVAGVTFASTTANLQLGNRGDTNAAFDGRVADLRLYSRYLSQADVWQLWVPQTRWELYRPAKRRTIVLAAPAAGQPTMRRWGGVRFARMTEIGRSGVGVY